MWIQACSELRDHPKTKRLMRALNISNAEALGHLLCLWWWATTYELSGDLSNYEPYEIAEAAGYNGDGDFLTALVKSGFVDETENGYVLHDWDQYGMALEAKKRTMGAERVRQYREKKAETSEETPCNAPVTKCNTPCNAPVTKCNTPCNADVTECNAREERRGEERKREENILPPIPPTRGEAKPAIEVMFEKFWDAYPKCNRKRDREVALKAFKKIKPSAETFNAIMAGLEADKRSKQWTRDNGDFIPLPTTWLNKRRWESAEDPQTKLRGAFNELVNHMKGADDG